MKRKILFLLTILCILFNSLAVVQARDKTIFIKKFSVVVGLPKKASILENIKDILEQSFTQESDYEITSDEDVRAAMEAEELSMSIGDCTDDSCVRKLMKSINADYIIYGKVKKIDSIFYITVKMLDRTSGTIRLIRIKTIRYKYRKDMESGVKALATYLITGDPDDVEDFQEDVFDREEEAEYRRQSSEVDFKEIIHDQEFDAEVKKAAKARERKICANSTQMRLGYGGGGLVKMKDSDLDRYYGDGKLYMFDILFPNIFGKRSGFSYAVDYYTRFAMKTFKMDEEWIEPLETAELNEDMVSRGSILMFAWDFGFRIRKGVYFLMTKFDAYVVGSMRLLYYREKADDVASNVESNDDLENQFMAYGCYTGGGIELSFFENMGIFGEYNIGYTPVGKSKANVEGHQVMFGIIYRN